MIEFTRETKEITLQIGKAERKCTVKTVSAYNRAEFQSRLLDTTTATIGNIQNGETKINVKALTEKDFLLLAWVLLSIEGEERWEKWSEKDRLAWLKDWADCLPDEFSTAVAQVKEVAGDLV